ncbi:unnamed protein product [Ilex paraguariensis]|uniref:Uncharacterized protein n=1 Tax=Ilex paraguariensis TaxID=185542 RepID=A0ABC8S8X1_9AQUA
MKKGTLMLGESSRDSMVDAFASSISKQVGGRASFTCVGRLVNIHGVAISDAQSVTGEATMRGSEDGDVHGTICNASVVQGGTHGAMAAPVTGALGDVSEALGGTSALGDAFSDSLDSRKECGTSKWTQPLGKSSDTLGSANAQGSVDGLNKSGTRAILRSSRGEVEVAQAMGDAKAREVNDGLLTNASQVPSRCCVVPVVALNWTIEEDKVPELVGVAQWRLLDGFS